MTPTLIIDLSGNNTMPDFAKLHSHGVRAVYLKASEGVTFDDPDFVEAWSRASKVGMVCGSYHFARQDLHPAARLRSVSLETLPLGAGQMGVGQHVNANVEHARQLESGVQRGAVLEASLQGAREEAEHYVRRMRELPGHGKHAWRKGDLRPVLDFEVGTPDHIYSPWRDAFQQYILEHAHHATPLYTYPGFNRWRTPERASQRQLWIADYDDNPPLKLAEVDIRIRGRRPSYPGGYTTHDLWQFTSRLSIPGAHEPVDASILPRGRHDALDALRCQRDG